MSLNDALQYKSMVEQSRATLASAQIKLDQELEQLTQALVTGPELSVKTLTEDPVQLNLVKEFLELALDQPSADKAQRVFETLFDTENVLLQITPRNGFQPDMAFNIHVTEQTPAHRLQHWIEDLITMIETVYVESMRFTSIWVTDRANGTSVDVARLYPRTVPDDLTGKPELCWWEGVTSNNGRTVAQNAAFNARQRLYRA